MATAGVNKNKQSAYRRVLTLRLNLPTVMWLPRLERISPITSSPPPEQPEVRMMPLPMPLKIPPSRQEVSMGAQSLCLEGIGGAVYLHPAPSGSSDQEQLRYLSGRKWVETDGKE